MSYSYDKFLRPLTESDKSIKILDNSNIVKYTIDPFAIVNVLISNNIIKMNLKSQKVILIDFNSKNEALVALPRLQEQINYLTNKVPTQVDKEVVKYVQSVFDQISIIVGPTGATGTQGEQGIQGPTGSVLQDIFYNIGSTVSATNSTSSIYRTGSLNIGSATVSNSRFVVSSPTGTASLVIDNDGNVYNRSKGVSNTIFGYQALIANTSGYNNTAIGNQSLLRNTYGIFNTALGASSLRDNTGDYNTAVGVLALSNNTLGEYNTAVGVYALNDNTIGNFNTAIGYTSLTDNTTIVNTLGTISSGSGYNTGTWSNVQLIYSTGSTADVYPRATIVVSVTGSVTSVTLTNGGSGFNDNTTILTAATSSIGNGTGFTIGVSTLSTGRQNTAIGHQSLRYNTIGTENVAIGFNSLFSNVSGSRNNALGRNTLYYNSTGDGNTAIGYYASFNNTTGNNNNSIGLYSLFNNTIGSNNTIIGNSALYNSSTGSNNTVIGYRAGIGLTESNWSTYIGSEVGSYVFNSINEIVIGASAIGYGSNTVVLGNDSIVSTYLKGDVFVSFKQITETITSINATASSITYNFSDGNIWYHATASTNFTANFTNLPTIDNKAITATIIISQGATGYSPTVVQISGVTQSIKWTGGTYSVSTNKVDIVGLTFIRSGATWSQVLGQINSFG